MCDSLAASCFAQSFGKVIAFSFCGATGEYREVGGFHGGLVAGCEFGNPGGGVGQQVIFGFFFDKVSIHQEQSLRNGATVTVKLVGPVSP